MEKTSMSKEGPAYCRTSYWLSKNFERKREKANHISQKVSGYLRHTLIGGRDGDIWSENENWDYNYYSNLDTLIP